MVPDSLSKDLVCNFCNRPRCQVGKLACGHKMCAICFPYFSAQLQKCYLCVLSTAEVKKDVMDIVSAIDDDLSDSAMDDFEKFFCPNRDCSFIGTKAEYTEHRETCKFQLLGSFDCTLMEDSRNLDWVNIAETPQPSAQRISRQVQSVTDHVESNIANLINEEFSSINSNRSRDTTAPRTPKIRLTDICFVGLLVAIFAICYPEMRLIRDDQYLINQPAVIDGAVKIKFPAVSSVVAKARMNKRDMVLSDPISYKDYQVKLGFGATLNGAENSVNLWVVAVVEKDNEAEWPLHEIMELRIEHPDRHQTLSYKFTPEQKGSWKEHSKIQKKALVFRQLQAESTDRMKFLRFSYLHTYEEAVSKKYIEKNTMTVSFELKANNAYIKERNRNGNFDSDE